MRGVPERIQTDLPAQAKKSRFKTNRNVWRKVLLENAAMLGMRQEIKPSGRSTVSYCAAPAVIQVPQLVAMASFKLFGCVIIAPPAAGV